MTAATEGQPKLARVLTLRHLVFYGIVCITPIAALPLFGITQQLSRGHAVVPILLAMIAMMFTAVSYGRMAALYPEAGSAYTYVGRVFDPRLGSLTGWLMCLDYGLIPLINVLYAALTLERLVPAVPLAVWVLGVTLLITALNLRGMQSSSRVNDVLLGLMMVVLTAFVVLAVRKLAGGAAGWSSLISSRPFFRPGEFQISAIATATSFAALTYIGFDAVSTLAEDAKNPRRDIPLATVLTNVFTGVSGGALVYLSQLLVPEYRHFDNVETAFLDVTRYAGGTWLFNAMAVVFLVAAAGSAFAGQAGAARLLYAMGRENVMPRKWFGRVEANGRLAPANIVFVGCAAAAGALLIPFERGAELLNFGAFFGFMGVNLAAFCTGWLHAPHGERSLLRDAAVPLAGFVFCLAIFVNLPRPALIAGGVWLVSGVFFLFLRNRRNTVRPLAGMLLLAAVARSAERPIVVRPVWDHVLRESVTNLNVQVCPEPPMRRGSPIHDKIYSALQALQADYNRFQPWFPYPRLTVAELQAPTTAQTSWDFTNLDPLLDDFMTAAQGRPVVVNLGPLPSWMFRLPKPVELPADPNAIVWEYSRGTELRDRTMQEAADYFRRVASWYIQGGFTDELGRRHSSPHKYRFDYWEVLNEVDIEHEMSPELYTALYDKIVQAVRPIDPAMKFMGPGLANPGLRPDFFQYFLDPKNHAAGVPVDAVSYHFYANPAPDESLEVMPHTMFAQADRIIDLSRHIDALRKRLSPRTQLHFNEIGTMLPDPQNPKMPPIPHEYWNLSGAVFSYIFLNAAAIGIEVASAAELIDYPGQFAATTLVHWDTGQPNARYWTLKMLLDHFRSGDRIIQTPAASSFVAVQAFETRAGVRKVLVVNKRNRSFPIQIPESSGGTVDITDQQTGDQPARRTKMAADTFTLDGYGVAVVSLPGASQP